MEDFFLILRRNVNDICRNKRPISALNAVYCPQIKWAPHFYSQTLLVLKVREEKTYRCGDTKEDRHENSRSPCW